LLRNFSFILLFLISALYPVEAHGQDTTKSLVYKNNKPPKRTTLFYQPDLAYRIWQQFNLIREANAGNPLAQHELGLRYLLGDGVEADTLQGAMWIKKAADQNLAAASFNYGILLLNGWGVNWNPFEAFRQFSKAADAGMSSAQHIIGLFYTDNLIVKRDWAEAYRWVKKAAEQNYQPAQESLAELIDKIPAGLLDTAFIKNKIPENRTSTDDNSLTSTLGLVFIDFDAITDSVTEITDKMLVADLANPGNDTLKYNTESLFDYDFNRVPLLIRYADNGSPEALTLLGRMYETGVYFKKDLITAAAYYIRASRLDSPKSPRLLYDLMKNNSPLIEIQSLTEKNDPEALFVWYGLIILGFDLRIAESDALNLLQRSASLGYIPAINELGLNYFTGNYLQPDKQKAVDLWHTAAGFDNNEAKIRLATGIIFDEINGSYNEAIELLKKFAEEGSVLAQAALGHAYEAGKGAEQSQADAVKYYRYAAQRGSRFAYEELKRIYDAIRPEDTQFLVY
jgi:uncharacterized protein